MLLFKLLGWDLKAKGFNRWRAHCSTPNFVSEFFSPISSSHHNLQIYCLRTGANQSHTKCSCLRPPLYFKSCVVFSFTAKIDKLCIQSNSNDALNQFVDQKQTSNSDSCWVSSLWDHRRECLTVGPITANYSSGTWMIQTLVICSSPEQYT